MRGTVTDSFIPPDPAATSAVPVYRRTDDEQAYRAGILEVLRLARHEIRIVDLTLESMGLESAIAAAAIDAQLATHPGLNLRIALHEPAWLLQRAPRLAALRLRAGHRIEVRQMPDHLRHLADSHLLADGCQGIRRFHQDHARAAISIDHPADIAPWWSRFEALWEECQALPASEFHGL